MNNGEYAPEFTLPDQCGTPRSLTGFLETGPVVLFFYPAAMTPGCTAEACHFRDHAAEFAAIGAHLVGISPDPVGKQQKFATTHDMGFPLLSDADAAVARQFGVRRAFGPLATKRHTFVIGTDRRVLGVVKSELRMAVHAERALAVLHSAG